MTVPNSPNKGWRDQANDIGCSLFLGSATDKFSEKVVDTNKVKMNRVINIIIIFDKDAYTSKSFANCKYLKFLTINLCNSQ